MKNTLRKNVSAVSRRRKMKTAAKDSQGFKDGLLYAIKEFLQDPTAAEKKERVTIRAILYGRSIKDKYFAAGIEGFLSQLVREDKGTWVSLLCFAGPVNILSSELKRLCPILDHKIVMIRRKGSPLGGPKQIPKAVDTSIRAWEFSEVMMIQGDYTAFLLPMDSESKLFQLTT